MKIGAVFFAISIHTAIMLAVTACQSTGQGVGSQQQIEQRYEAALSDAAHVVEGRNYPELFAISDKNSRIERDAMGRIKVLTWKSNHGYANHIERHDRTFIDAEFVLWVTAVPQVKEFCQQFMAEAKPDAAALDLRLKQYLGLRYDWPYDVFVEMWIDPRDLFRPCVDPEIDDNQCNLAFTARRAVVPNIPDYRDFFEHLYFKSFRHKDRMPWTGLGYTYDWGREDKHVGASEYIVRPDAPYGIERVVSTQAYCQPS